jgi:hypothetical protein
MTLRPLTYLNWTDGDSSKQVQPPANFLLQGWTAGMRPPFEYANWQIWLLDQWVQYLDQITNTGSPDQVMRLLNGGIWAFNATTGLLSWSLDANLRIPGIPDSNNAILAGNVTVPDGNLVYVVVNPPIITQGDTSTSIDINKITGLNFVGNLSIGMTVTGLGIPASTTVLGVGTDSVTLSNNVTSDNTDATYIFSNTGALTPVVVQSDTFVPSLTTIIIAVRSGPKVYVGVNSGQMLLRDGEFKTLLGSGYFDVYEAPAGENLLAGQLVYISEGAADSGRTAGRLYKLDVSSTNQAKRGTFAGVVISDTLTGATVSLVYNGLYKFSSLTAGTIYYADPTTPGGITGTQPSGAGQKIIAVGFATNTTDLIVTTANGIGGSFTQPVLKSEIIGYGNGVLIDFNLTTLPLSQQAIFLFIDGIVQPITEWSLLSQTITLNTPPGVGVEVYAQYILAGQSYLTGFQEVPSGAINSSNTEFDLTSQPSNQASTFVFVDGISIPNTEWTLTLGPGVSKITLNTAPSIGQDVYVAYLSPVGVGGGGGSVTGAANVGTMGIGVFKVLSGTTLDFKKIKAGANIGVTDLGDEVEIAATFSGGSPPAIHGTLGTPIDFDPTLGLTIGSENDQIWFIKPSIPGENIVTAVQQISAGSFIGQRISLRGTSSSDYFTFRCVGGGSVTDGLSMNGDVKVTNNQTIDLFWDGVSWYEDSRRQ